MDKEDVVYTHNGLLLNHQKKWNSAIYNNVVDLKAIMLSETGEMEKDKYSRLSLIYGI